MCYGYDGHSALDCALESRGMDRRKFLRGAMGAGLVAGVGAGSLAGAPSAQAKVIPAEKRGRVTNNRISIQLYTLRSILGDGGFDPTLEALADMGYRKVELAGYYGRTAAELHDYLDSIGISPTSAHEGISADYAGLMQKMENVVTLEQDYVVVPYLNSGSADDWKMWADQMNMEAMVAKREGVRYGYHNHAHEFTQVLDDGSTAWEILTDRLDPKLVHFEIDLYWVVTGGIGVGAADPHQFAIDVMESAPQRVRQFHVKDKHEDQNGDMADLGTGFIDFARLFKAAQVDEYIVENDTPDVTPLQTAQIGIDYLRAIRF